MLKLLLDAELSEEHPRETTQAWGQHANYTQSLIIIEYYYLLLFLIYFTSGVSVYCRPQFWHPSRK